MKNIISKKIFSDFSILLIFLLHFCSLAASKSITLSETYYYGKDLSENKACEIALNNAKKKSSKFSWRNYYIRHYFTMQRV